MTQSVTILGAGLAGLTTTAILSNNKGLQIHLIEKNDITDLNNHMADSRTIFLSYGCKLIFEKFGLWELLANHAEPIEDIVVQNGYSPFILHYGEDLIKGNHPIGYNIENYVVKQNLYQYILKQDNVIIKSPCTYKAIDNTTDITKVWLSNEDDSLDSELLISAEGKFSRSRDLCGISTIEHDYNQSIFAFNVEHSKNHNRVAYECFLPAGPFAILPMKGGYKSSIIWTEDTEEANKINDLTSERFLDKMYDKIGDKLGEIELTHKIRCYPISMLLSKSYYKNRLLLIGDTAHTIHPVAAQGFNLSVYDINALYKSIETSFRIGASIGCRSSLESFTKERYNDNMLISLITDILNRGFMHKSKIINKLRTAGLLTLNKCNFIKRQIMNKAMGLDNI